MRRITSFSISGLLLLVLWSTLTVGQQVSEIVPDTTNREFKEIANCLKQSEYFITRNKDSSIYYLILGSELIKKSELTVAPGLYFEIARQYHRNNEYRKALEFFTLSSIHAGEINDPLMLVHSGNWAGYIHSQLGESEDAIEILLTSLDIAEKNNISDYLAETFMMLGFAYRDSKDTENAMKYFTAAKESAERTGITGNLASILGEIGNLQVLSGNISQGLEYQFQALEMRTKAHDSTLIGYSYNDIANSYFLNKDYNRAISYFEKSLTLHKQMKNEWASFYGYINLASIFSEIKLFTLQKAYLDSAKTLADNLRMKPVYQLYHENCLQYFENINDFKEVYIHYKLLTAYSDSLESEEMSRRIAEITAQYDAERKDREIEQQKIINQKLKLLTFLLVTGIALLVAVTILFIRSYIIKKKVNAILEQKNREIIEKNEILQKNSREIITRRDELQFQRDEYQKLNATKDKFFSIIAHDLKNPFSGLIGLTDILISDNKSFSEEELKEVYSDLNQTSRVTFSLLENLLLWARNQTKSLHIEPEIIDAGNLNSEIIALYEKQAKAKNIEINSDDEPGLEYFADLNMIRTVLRNLVSNALKFTNENGMISIKGRKEGEYAVISVEDTGIGIDEVGVSKIFRIDVNTSLIGNHHDKGSGLGLILCKEFVELNGGEITVESTPGKGSIFTFTIPLPEYKSKI
ncbi:MAG: ATP-binding protein [Bacteroidota bacterium]